jgi:tetratricopeptide (TPR) repeat protein
VEQLEPGSPASAPLVSGQLTRLLAQLAEAPADRPAARIPLPGEQLGRFRVVREIGRGGFGVVLEAEDTELGRRVAVKVLPWGLAGEGSDPEALREAETAARLRHPNIVTLHDAGPWAGGTYLVYELLHGETLAARLAAGPLPKPEARRILRAVAAALAHAHRAGVVHRDLKPENVFLEADGGVKLLDLGLAQAVGARGHAAGSPSYVAPEQWRGEVVDARADVHAWGVLAHRLLRGRLPRGASAVPPASSPRRLSRLAEGARAADPGVRPADGAALVAAIERVERLRTRARAAVVALAVVAVTVVVSIGAARVLRPPPAPPAGPMRVAVADVANGSGDPALDGAGALLARALEPSSRLRVLDPARLGGALRASGRAAPERIDARSATLGARVTGAAAVLLPAVELDPGGGFTLRVEALEPETARALFAVAERAGTRDEVLPALDRLALQVREALHEREADVRTPDQEIARVVSVNEGARERFLAARRCLERPSEGPSWIYATDCERPLAEALAIDPDFALAHAERVRVAFWYAHPPAELRARLAPALARADRLLPREQAQLRAFEAELDGGVARAAELLRDALAEYPEDTGLLLSLAQLFHRTGRYAEAIDPLERIAALDPGHEVATDMLAGVLGVLDRAEALSAFAERMAASPPSAGTLHAEVHARAWLGDVERALAIARRAAVGGRGAAREDLLNALVAAGRYAEAEALLREDLRRGDAVAPHRLAALLVQLGRAREAQRLLPEARDDMEPRLAYVAGSRAINLRHAAARDVAAILRIVERTRAWSNETGAELAPVLAYAGGVDEAEALATAGTWTPTAREMFEAIVAWRRGAPAAALPPLRRLARGEPEVFVTGSLPPDALAWLAAECAFDAGEGEAALADVRWYQRFYFPLSLWRAWAYPRSLVLEATLLERLGRRGEASDALARLERLWVHADADLPLRAEARALRRRLGPRGQE